jgi:hypothetical protein
MSDDSSGRSAMSVTADGGAAVRAARQSAPRRRDRALPNSPWIRGAPHRGFATAICSTSLRMLALVLGRPGRVGLERCVHRRRSHCRCHRTTVSGRTTISAERQSRQEWARSTQNSRSRWRTEGRGTVRLNTANCWRSARFSSATAWCPPQIRASDRSTTTSAASMSDRVAQPTTE